jgi:hypothetical protein
LQRVSPENYCSKLKTSDVKRLRLAAGKARAKRTARRSIAIEGSAPETPARTFAASKWVETTRVQITEAGRRALALGSP